MMNEAIQKALQEDRLVDITVLGRKSGKPHRFEITLHRHDGNYYILGRPGGKDWYANMLAHPEIILHLTKSAQADLPAATTPIHDEATRRDLFQRFMGNSDMMPDLEEFVRGAKLVQIHL
ncbi:MAG: nitroreductase/quinone reductase family protein [Chloroflexota bacterium]